MTENPYLSGDRESTWQVPWHQGYEAGRTDTLTVAGVLADALRELAACTPWLGVPDGVRDRCQQALGAYEATGGNDA